MQQKKGSFKVGLEYALFAGMISLVTISPPRGPGPGKEALVFFLKKAVPGTRG